jgi:hypothetical protein
MDEMRFHCWETPSDETEVAPPINAATQCSASTDQDLLNYRPSSGACIRRQAGGEFRQTLMLPVSNDTLLRACKGGRRHEPIL